MTSYYIVLRENSSWDACEKWLTSSFEDRESALMSRRYGVPGFFFLLLYWNWCSYRLDMGVSGNLWIVVKYVKTLVVYDVEWQPAMDSMMVVFPVVMYGCESWTIKKAESLRIDAFKLWCWGRLLIVHSKEIKPVDPKGNQLWILTGRTDAEAPIFWQSDVKR